VSAILRIEIIRPRRAGDTASPLGSAVLQFFQAEVMTLGAAPANSLACPAGDIDQGLTGGLYARVICLAGAAIVSMPAADPASGLSALTGFRLDQGAEKLIPIATGQKLAAMEDPRGSSGGLKTVKSAALEGGKVIKAVPGDLRSISVLSTASDGFLLLLDAAAVPGNGAVAPIGTPIPVVAGVPAFATWDAAPLHFDTGLVAVFSTSADPFTLALGANCFFSAQVI